MEDEIYDCVGIGCGPSNLSVAAQLYGLREIRYIFFEKKTEFSWHSGMMLPDVSLQVSMFKDLVTLADPTNPFSFLSYLHQHGRLLSFLNAKFAHVLRSEFSAYLKWAAHSNKNISFGQEVNCVEFDGSYFIVRTAHRKVLCRNVIVGVGIEPYFDSRLEHCLRFDIKETHFVEGVGLLDVYHDGLSPYFLRSECIDAIPTVKQQTARWPGFYDCVRSLNSLGLLDEQVLPGAHASPSDLVHEILLRNGRLARGRPDISFVEVNTEFATGERAALRILSRFDEQSGLTGMAQLTSFLAAWTTLRISDSATLHQQGVTLSHEFYGRETTRELLVAYKRYVKCSVSALP